MKWDLIPSNADTVYYAAEDSEHQTQCECACPTEAGGVAHVVGDDDARAHTEAGGVAHVVGDDDARVETLEVEHKDRRRVERGLRGNEEKNK
jgi:hypothetical protein